MILGQKSGSYNRVFDAIVLILSRTQCMWYIVLYSTLYCSVLVQGIWCSVLLWYSPGWCSGLVQCVAMVLTRPVQWVGAVCCYGTYQTSAVRCYGTHQAGTHPVGTVYLVKCLAIVLTRPVQWAGTVFGAVCCYGTHQAGAVDAEGRLEVGCFVEVVFEAVSEGVAVRADKVRLHLRLTDHPVPVSKNKTMVLLQCLHLRLTDHPGAAVNKMRLTLPLEQPRNL